MLLFHCLPSQPLHLFDVLGIQTVPRITHNHTFKTLSRESELVSSTHTNMSLFNKKHQAINVPLTSLDHCNVTWQVFFESPYLLHTVLREISIPNTCIISTHNSPRYIDGFSKITQTTYNSLRSKSPDNPASFVETEGLQFHSLQKNGKYGVLYLLLRLNFARFSRRFIAILW